MHEPIEFADVETHVESSEEDNTIVTRKSKRRRAAKSFGEDYIIYLMDDTPKTIQEAYSSLDVDLWKKVVNIRVRWTLLCLMELGRLLIVLTGANLWDANGC